MMAGHRLHGHLNVFGLIGISGEVAVDANPMHFAATQDLFLADHRDVVLGLAGHHAGVAADALGQIDRHAPAVPVVLQSPPQRLQRRMMHHVFGEVGMLLVVLERRLADQRPDTPLPFFQAHRVDGKVVLGRGQAVFLPGRRDRQSAGDVGRGGRPQRVRVRSHRRDLSPGMRRPRRRRPFGRSLTPRPPSRLPDRASHRPGSPTSGRRACSVTSCWLLTPSSRAVAGLIKAALSHVSLVSGSGHSCSQLMLAKRPS